MMKVDGVYISDSKVDLAVEMAFKSGHADFDEIESAFRKIGIPERGRNYTNLPYLAAQRVIAKLKRDGKISLIHTWVLN